MQPCYQGAGAPIPANIHAVNTDFHHVRVCKAASALQDNLDMESKRKHPHEAEYSWLQKFWPKYEIVTGDCVLLPDLKDSC